MLKMFKMLKLFKMFKFFHRLILCGCRLIFRNKSLRELEILLRRQSFAIHNLVFIHASVADADADADADVGVALVVLVVVDVAAAAAVRHVVVAEVVGGFRIGCDDKLLKFALINNVSLVVRAQLTYKFFSPQSIKARTLSYKRKSSINYALFSYANNFNQSEWSRDHFKPQ